MGPEGLQPRGSSLQGRNSQMELKLWLTVDDLVVHSAGLIHEGLINL